MLSLDELLLKISKYNPVADFELIKKAYLLAEKKHTGQVRASGEEYFSHPVSVAEILTNYNMDTESICTALLHDVVEDTDTTIAEIIDDFGEEIANMIDGVTKIGRIKFSSSKHRQAANFRKFILAIATDIRILIVKLADRLHNMRTLQYIESLDKRRRIATETIEIYAPLAERIGMQSIVEELQDLVFKHLHPYERSLIMKRVKYIYVKEESLINDIIDRLKRNFIDGNLGNVTISGRAKSPYSIWCKMHKRNISFDQIADLIGFRIITNTVEECYKALYIIHTNYMAFPYTFKDYISTPKPNGYQSLHTYIFGPLNQKIEVQIRTEDMHSVAETGIAAHWSYKINRSSTKKNDETIRYRWIRGFLQIAEDASTPDDLMHDSKLEMFRKEIFCFTPQGDIISLPKHSTAIDMAYAIHTFVGNTCVNVKINGTMMPLNTRLSNGDRVEIMTRATQKPDKEWLKFVVTGKAKSAIKKYIKMTANDENISNGYSIFTNLLMEKGISINNSVFIKELISILTPDSDKNGFYEKIGDGTINQKILKNLISNLAKTLLVTNDIEVLSEEDRALYKNSLVIGLKAFCKIKFADCCRPVPGDEIIALEDDDGSMVVHRVNCKRVEKIAIKHSEKIIDVKWNKFNRELFPVKLKIITLNQPGSLAQVATVISMHGINLINISIRDNAIDFSSIYVEMMVENISVIDSVCASLRANIRVKAAERI